MYLYDYLSGSTLATARLSLFLMAIYVSVFILIVKAVLEKEGRFLSSFLTVIYGSLSIALMFAAPFFLGQFMLVRNFIGGLIILKIRDEILKRMPEDEIANDAHMEKEDIPVERLSNSDKGKWKQNLK